MGAKVGNLPSATPFGWDATVPGATAPLVGAPEGHGGQNPPPENGRADAIARESEPTEEIGPAQVGEERQAIHRAIDRAGPARRHLNIREPRV